jgi:N6-L-threonylcarbamoyladenine synthase
VEDDGIRSLAVVGGVAANQELRRRLDALCESRGWTMVVPPPRLCTDQGAMSAWAAVERLLVGSSDDPTTQEVYARYPFASVSSVQESQLIGEQGKA